MTFLSSATRFSERFADAGARWLGVTNRTSALAFLGAVVLCALLLAAFSVAPVWRAYGWLPQTALRSDRVRLVNALATRWSARSPDVLFIGGSQIREAMPGEDFIAADLSAACGGPITVFNAASSAQLPESSWAIIEQLRDGIPPLVVIGVNLWRDATDPLDAPRLARALLPLPQPAGQYADEVTLRLSRSQRLKNDLGIVFSDALATLRAPAPGPASDSFDGPQHLYHGDSWPAEHKAIDGHYQALVAHQTPAAVLRRNAASYAALARMIAARGGRTAFLLTPESPEFAAQFRPLGPRVTAALDELANVGVLLDLRATGQLAGADFHDSVHLRADGRRRLWPELRRAILAHLPGCESPKR